MEFTFYNVVTQETKIVFADDTECAWKELEKEVPTTDNWVVKRSSEEDPIGLDYFED